MIKASHICTLMIRRPFINSIIAATAIVFGTMLGSCSAVLLNQTVLAQAKDKVAPVLTITSPEDGYLCANLVEVRGVATDKTNDGTEGKVVTLTYEVPGSLTSGTVTPSEDGSFVILLNTDSFQSGFSVKVTAVDWNGNTSSKGLSLGRLSASSLPSFSAVGSNKTVVLTWDAVPDTESYTIYYTLNGALPSETVGTQVVEAVSPYAIPCDDNGLLYTFRIKARARNGNPDSLSGFVRAIPLSDQTLCPDITSGRGELKITWKEIPATNEFELYRRVGEQGDFSFYRRVIGNESIDSSVENDVHYYYRVKPNEYSDVLSAAGAAQSDGFARGYDMATIDAVTLWFPTLTWRDNVMYAAGRGGVQILLTDLDNYELARITKTVVYQAITPENSNYLYLAAGTDGFLIYDVYNPAVPVLKGSFSEPGIDIRGMVLDSTNGRVWLASYCKTVYCLDISDPEHPSSIKSFPLDRTETGTLLTNIGTETVDFPDRDPIDMLIGGNGANLYVGNRKGGLQIYDTAAGTGSNPVLTVFDTNHDLSVIGLAAQGNYIYACYFRDGVKTVDISIPASASIIGTTTDYSSGWYTDISIEGSTAFVTNAGTGVEVYDISRPSELRLLRVIPTEIGFGGSGTHSLALHEGYAYIFHHKSNLNNADSTSLFKVDLNMPVGVKMANSLDIPGASGMAIEGTRAYIAAGSTGLLIYDIADPLTPVLLGTVATESPAYKVIVKAERAYVIVNYQWYYMSKIEIFDVSDPGSPEKLGVLDVATNNPGQMMDLVVQGDYAYVVGNYDIGFSVFDVSDPRNASLVRHHVIPFQSSRIRLSGRYAIIADWGSALTIFDIGDPLKTTLVKTLPGTNEIRDFAMSGDYGFFSMEPRTSGDTFKFIIRNMINPTAVDTSTDKVFSYPGISFNDDEWMDAVAGLGSFAIASTLEVNTTPTVARLRIYDISDFSQSRLISELIVDDFVGESASEFNHELKIAGSVIYALGTDGKLRIYDMRP